MYTSFAPTPVLSFGNNRQNSDVDKTTSGWLIQILLTYHSVLRSLEPGDAESWVGRVVIAIDRYLPVVDALREPHVTEDDAVVVVVARQCHVVVGEEHVLVRGGRIEAEPSHCKGEQLNVISSTVSEANMRNKLSPTDSVIEAVSFYINISLDNFQYLCILFYARPFNCTTCV